MPTPADQLLLTLVRSLRDYAPVVATDTSPEGTEIRILTIPNPTEPRWGLQTIWPAEPDGRGELYGSLWFGAVEITGHLSAEDAESTIRAVLDGEITAVLRYKDPEALSDHHPAGPGRVFLTLPGEEDAVRLTALRERMSRPVTLMERIRGRDIGVFEFADWQTSEIIRHLPPEKERKHT